MDLLVGIVVMIGIIVVSVGMSFAIGGIITAYNSLIDEKRRQTHPQLWSWFEECNEACKQESMWYNSQIAPLKQKIDTILAKWDYYSAETRHQKEEELENLRKAIEIADIVYTEMCNKTQAIRSKIHNYVEEHDLEWARHSGW